MGAVIGALLLELFNALTQIDRRLGTETSRTGAIVDSLGPSVALLSSWRSRMPSSIGAFLSVRPLPEWFRRIHPMSFWPVAKTTALFKASDSDGDVYCVQ